MAFRRRNNNFSRPSSGKKHSDENQAILNKPIENPLEPVSMENVSEAIQGAYQRAGWAEIMPVQAHSIPYLLAGRHMMVQSRTGSGKTGAYLVPLIEKLNIEERKTQALVLVPTRELAVQVEKEAQNLFGNNLSTLTLYGGVPYYKQLDALRKGVQIIIGTPGRILDHLQRGTLKLDDLSALIFDEADRMLSIGFYPDMKALQEYLPENDDLLVTLFSATYPAKVLELAKQFLKNPELLSLSQGQVHIAKMEHSFVACTRMDKDRVLMKLLETENPSSSIIFCNTKATVHYVAQVLKGFGYGAEELSSELTQAKREYVLNRLRKGETRFLVATDVAARGIDVPLLSHVFLYEPPEDRESYIHRAGRTARANAAGTVISLVDSMEKRELNSIAEFYEIDLMQIDAPSDEAVANAVSQRVMALLEQEKRALNGLQKERIERFQALAKELAVSEDGEKNEDFDFFIAMLLDQVYQKSLNPTPEYSHRGSKPGGRDSRRSYPKSKKELQEKQIEQDDTLDSLRDAFHDEMRSKYGNKRGGDRNAAWRHKNNDSYGDRDGGSRKSWADKGSRSERSDRGDRNDRGRDRNFGDNRGERPRRFEEKGFRNDERRDRGSFDRGNRPFRERSNNDNDVFRDSDKNFSEFSGKPVRERGERSSFSEFASKNTFDKGYGDRNRRPRREEGFDNDSNGDFNRRSARGRFAGSSSRFDSREERNSFSSENDVFKRKSFLPSRGGERNEGEQRGFRKFQDDEFMTPLRSSERKPFFGKDDDRGRNSRDGGRAPFRNDNNSRNFDRNNGKKPAFKDNNFDSDDIYTDNFSRKKPHNKKPKGRTKKGR